MRHFFYFIIIFIWNVISCNVIEVNQKNIFLPQQQWPSNYKPCIELQSPDSAAYNLYIIIRHTQQFAYNNLLGGIRITDTAKHLIEDITINIPLTNKFGNWNGNKIDDLYDHRILIGSKPILLKKKRYRFILRQLMKDNPLQYVLNIGIAIKKANL